MKSVSSVYNFVFDFCNSYILDNLTKVEDAKTDNEILFNLQVDFLKDGNKKAEAELWIKFKSLCLKAVKKELKHNNLKFDNEEIEYKADIACEYVLRRYHSYKVKGDLYIIKNFVAQAYYGAQHAIYAECENDIFLDSCESLENINQRKVIK